MESGGAKTSRKRKSSDSGGVREQTPTYEMILKWHDVWTKVTMSGFFDEVQRQSVTDEQLEEWIRFRQLLAGRLVLACNRLKKAGTELPCIEAIEEDNRWLTKFAKDIGVDPNPNSSRLSQINEIIKYMDSITVLDADTTAAGVGIWAILFSCWQGWNLTLERAKSQMDSNFKSIGSHLAREAKVEPLLNTATLLDKRVSMENMKSCEDVFCGALQRISEFYEELLFQGWTEDAMRCKKCGRFGHMDAKCLFKAKAARAG